MNCIKTLNELLTKSLFILLFFLVCKVGYGQTPILTFGDPNVQDVELTGLLAATTFSGVIDRIDFTPEDNDSLIQIYGPNAIVYEVQLDFDFDWGPITSSQTDEVLELDFDIYLDGFNDWYFWPDEILFCNDGETYTYTQNETNPHIWHINVNFGDDGATFAAFSCQTSSLAAVAIIIDGANRDYLTASYDCYDYHNEVTANVLVSNAKFTVRNGKNSGINTNLESEAFTQTYNLPSCFRDDLANLGTYDINLMISDVNDDGIAVDLYLRSYTGAGNPPVKGDVHVFYNTDNFYPADVESGSPVNGTLSQLDFTGNYSSTVFSFDNAVGLDADQIQIYLGTLLYAYKTDAIDAGFLAHPATQVWDENDIELVLEGLEFETISGSPSSNKMIIGKTQNKIVISPNPASGIIRLTIPSINKNASLSILDIQGKQVLSGGLISEGLNNTQLDVSFLQKGLYLIKVEDEMNSYQSRLIID